MNERTELKKIEELRLAVESKNWFDAVQVGETLMSEGVSPIQVLKHAAKANIEVGNNATALLLLESIHRNDPDDIPILIALTRAQVNLGDAENALKNFTSLTSTTSSTTPKQRHMIRLDIADLLLRLNQLDALEDMLREWQSRKLEGPRIASLRHKLQQARGRLDEAADGFESLTKDPKIGNGLRLQTLFDLSKVLDRLGRHDEAFEAARQANEDPLGDAFPFDREAYRAETDRMIRFFTPERFEQIKSGNEQDDSSVFIIGMPRSGTTLTEQVISAHPDAAGIGEQREPIVACDMLAHLTGTPFPECLTEASEKDIASLGSRYLKMSRSLSNDARRITNKALGLDRSLGLIEAMLPGSRAIFVRRHELDNLLSIYLHPLPARLHPWSRSIEDIVFVRREFDRLLAHWLEVSSLPIFELEYEAFTRNQESTTERLLEFLGLPPAEECLRFHESRRYVRTPSYDQVDKPLNQNAIERWRNYERHLGPAIEAFGG